MRLSTITLAATLAVLFLACGGDNDADDAPKAGEGVIPTATPYARLPNPTIVSGDLAAGTGTPATGAERRYVVVAGDSLSAIAARFDTTVEVIVQRNRLGSASDIQIGQQLIVPGGRSIVAGAATETPMRTATPATTTTPVATATRTPTAATPAVTATTASGPQQYIVEPGDTASEIAEEFGITQSELAATNDMTVDELDELQAGMVLTIPRPTR